MSGISGAHHARFGFHDPVRGAAALAELQRVGYAAWAFTGDEDFAVTVYVEAREADRTHLEAVVIGIDDTAIAIRAPSWDPLRGA